MPSKLLRFRNIYMYGVTLLVLLSLFILDPDSGFLTDLKWGASTIASVLIIMKSVLGTALLHVTRKAFFDYIDMGDIYDKVMADKESSTGASLFAVAVGLFAVAFAIIITKAM